LSAVSHASDAEGVVHCGRVQNNVVAAHAANTSVTVLQTTAAYRFGSIVSAPCPSLL
jgi:hypothetical protein